MISLATVCVVVMSACATTQLKEQWRDANYQPASTPRVLVIGVIGNPERRRTLENKFVARLRQENIEAIPSYPSLSVNGPADLDAARRSVDRAGANMVLTVRVLSVSQHARVTPQYDTGSYGPAGFYTYYRTYTNAPAYTNLSADAYESRAAVSTHRDFLTETRVFDMEGDKMVWAATLETTEPSNFDDAAEQYTNVVVKQIRDNKIIVSR